MMNVLKNQYWFKKSDYQTETLKETVDKEETKKEDNKKLYCINCKTQITELDNVITINGSHTHTFSNPAGFVYTIGCFSSAVSCTVVGELTEEHTWFLGYKWKIVMCQSCQLQLGWLFTNSDSFYAFIEKHLTHVI